MRQAGDKPPISSSRRGVGLWGSINWFQADTNWENHSKAGKQSALTPCPSYWAHWQRLGLPDLGGLPSPLFCWAQSRQKHSLVSHIDSSPRQGPVSGRSIVLGSKGWFCSHATTQHFPNRMLSTLTLPLCQTSTWPSDTVCNVIWSLGGGCCVPTALSLCRLIVLTPWGCSQGLLRAPS